MDTGVPIFDVEIPGFGWVMWGARLEDLAIALPDQNTITRLQHPSRAEFQPHQCPRRSALITTSGTVCGMEAVAQMNFRDGRLCAVHYHFPLGQPGESEEFCAVVDCLRRKLSRVYGEPSLVTNAESGVTLDYRWRSDGLHIEVRATVDTEQELVVLANDPQTCDWCR